MPTLRFVFYVLFLSYLLSSGSTLLPKQGSGWDPSGLTVTAPPVQPDQGSGWDPWG